MIRLALMLFAVALVGCGTRATPSAMLESYDTIVMPTDGSGMRDQVNPKLERMAFTVLSAGDERLSDAATASRALLASVRSKNGFLSAHAWVELRDYRTNELVFSAEDGAKFWINGRARAAKGAFDLIHVYYHGFSKHLYDVRMSRESPKAAGGTF
jgi:hypothetical protein